VLCAISLSLMAVSAWFRWQLRAQEASLHVDWLEGTVNALGFAGIPVVGALIASRLPANPYGWLWCGVGLAYGLADVGRPLIQAAAGPPWLAWVVEAWGFIVVLGLFVFVFLLFPTGRLPTRRWRWLARSAVAGALLLACVPPLVPDPANPSAVSPWAPSGAAGRFLSEAADVGIVVMLGLVLAGMCSLVFRFRRAGPVVRRQLTWFLYATAVNAAILVLDSVLGVLPVGLVTAVVSAAGFALLPVAVGVAMLRYRLFEIDRIVSRTVSYGLLSAALVALYLVVVALLRPLLEPLTGSSALAVAGSTLAVAAAFNPARQRLQSAVDRRFDRARYDAARAVDAFAARLRDQVDLDAITAGLRDTVAGTVAPTSIGVWLRGPAGLRKG
jgi:hypothetical protein